MTARQIASKLRYSVFLALLLLNSCTEEIDFNDSDSNNVRDETASDAYFAESEDITAVTVSADNETSGGRLIEVDDPRLACAVVAIEPDITSTVLYPRGILSIDFGNGCRDNQGTVRKGKITISYFGRRFLPASYVVTKLIGFEINGVKIEGTRTIVNSSASSLSNPVFTTTMEGGKITWPDGKTILRDEITTSELKPGTTSDQNEWLVSGSASGTTRQGVDYSMTIGRKLVYKRSCAVNNNVFVAVSGVKELVAEHKKVTIDYGNGECDKLVTVTVRSKSKTIELN